MKNALLALVAIALGAVSATAQNHLVYTVYDGVGDGLNANTTNTPTAVLEVGDYRQVSALLSYKLWAGTNGAVHLGLVRSPDGVNYESTNFVTLSFTTTSTNVSGAITNFDVGAAHSIKINNLINANTNFVTNLVVVLSAKK